MLKPVISWKDGACTITAGDSWLVFYGRLSRGLQRFRLRGLEQLQQFSQLGQELQRMRNHSSNGSRTIGEIEVCVQGRHDIWSFNHDGDTIVRLEGHTFDDLLAWTAAACGNPQHVLDDLEKLSVFREYLICRSIRYPVQSETELVSTILAALGDEGNVQSWQLPLGSGARLERASYHSYVLTLPGDHPPLTLKRSSLARFLTYYCDSPPRGGLPF